MKLSEYLLLPRADVPYYPDVRAFYEEHAEDILLIISVGSLALAAVSAILIGWETYWFFLFCSMTANFVFRGRIIGEHREQLNDSLNTSMDLIRLAGQQNDLIDRQNTTIVAVTKERDYYLALVENSDVWGDPDRPN